MFKFATVLGLAALLLPASSTFAATENFIGSFAEPLDGGNIDTRYSTFDGTTAVIVPRSHASEAISGATRWRNVLFAIRGVAGKAPVFRLPITSPGTGRVVLSGDTVSFQNIKLVWSYEPNAIKWNRFDSHVRSGASLATWKIDAQNSTPFTQDVVYVSINEHFPVADYYDWLETDVFRHPFVRATPSESSAGTFIIGYQSGAAASTACSRAIPNMPLYSFIVGDPAAHPSKLVLLVSGQHPYEGQNKVALQGAVDWILNSTSAEAKAYRATYLTVVYPFVNPTGELGGLWRGTAYAPTKDCNRNWTTTETIPANNRGIDTVIIHKNAMRKDIAALGLGEPYAVFDYHQNFGDHVGAPDYVLHATASTATTVPMARQVAAAEYAPFYGRLAAMASIADMPSDLTTQETLRGYMLMRGVHLPLTFERSVYNTIASEWAFGVATMQALVDPATIVAVTSSPGSTVTPVPEEPSTTTTISAPSETTSASTVTTTTPAPSEVVDSAPTPTPTWLVIDDFTGSGSLANRKPDGVATSGAAWKVESGYFGVAVGGEVATNNSARAVIDAGAADGEISGVVDLLTANTGLVLRSSDSANYLRFVLTNTSWQLQKTAAGGTSALATGKGSFAAGDHTLTANLAGSSIKLSIDGTLVGSVVVDFNQTATRHGLVSSGSGNRGWASFSVRSL